MLRFYVARHKGWLGASAEVALGRRIREVDVVFGHHEAREWKLAFFRWLLGHTVTVSLHVFRVSVNTTLSYRWV